MDEQGAAGDPSRFALELHTSGLLGALSGGLFLGAGTHALTWGAGLDVGYTKYGSQSATYLRIAPGVRFLVASTDEKRLDLLIDAEVGWRKNSIGDGNGFVASDGHSFEAAVGPALRLWITKSLALSYAALLTALVRENRNTSVVSLSGNPQQLGQIGPALHSDDATYVYLQGELQFTGYF